MGGAWRGGAEDGGAAPPYGGGDNGVLGRGEGDGADITLGNPRSVPWGGGPWCVCPPPAILLGSPGAVTPRKSHGGGGHPRVSKSSVAVTLVAPLKGKSSPPPPRVSRGSPTGVSWGGGSDMGGLGGGGGSLHGDGARVGRGIVLGGSHRGISTEGGNCTGRSPGSCHGDLPEGGISREGGSFRGRSRGIVHSGFCTWGVTRGGVARGPVLCLEHLPPLPCVIPPP